MDQLRPISVEKLKFKIISKILGIYRLSNFMPNLVSKEHKGFLK